MPTVVGIFNTPPVYVMGLAGAFAGTDFHLEDVADPVPWLRRHRGAAVLVGVHDPDDLGLVVELKIDDPESVVITLLDPLDVDSIQASLQAGATGSIDLNASADDVFLTLHAAMSQHTVLPTMLARRMVRDTSIVVRPGGVGDDEVSLLRALASGETVAVLGQRLGYSEREMYRRLRRLYSRMGARGRTDALLRAAKWGLLD